MYYVHRINRDMLCFDTVSVPVSLELDLLCNKVVKYHTGIEVKVPGILVFSLPPMCNAGSALMKLNFASFYIFFIASGLLVL